MRKIARQDSIELGYPRRVSRFVTVVMLLVALSGCQLVFSEGPNSGSDASGDADGVGVDSDSVIACTPFCDPRGLVCGTAVLQGCVNRCVAAGPVNGDVAHCNGFEPSNVPANDSWGLLGQVDGEVVLTDGIYSMHSDTGEIVKDATQEVIRKGGPDIIAGIRFKTLASGLGLLGVNNLRIGANAIVNVVGPAGLVIVVRNNVDIAGDIDASAHVNPGPGGGLGGTAFNDATGCGRGVRGQSALNAEAGGGGSGGSFGTAAGDGGGLLKADARGPCSGTLRATLLGGSGGGAAGAQNYQGVGGNGGGAVQITAGHSIVVRGRLAANGSGGAGADSTDSGGGGGGSGGGWLLEAPVVKVFGGMFANGGGGGSGNQGDAGRPGRLDRQPTPGGGGGGGVGGAGGAATAVAQNGTQNSNFSGPGGGGGGSVGKIEIRSANFGPVQLSAVVSPLADETPLP